MSGEHSILAPSSADIWAHCAGSVSLSEIYPRAETEDTREGEAVHWVNESTLYAWVKGDEADPRRRPSAFLEAEAPNGVIITEEMVEAANVFVDQVMAFCQKHGALRRMHIEERMPIKRIHEKCFGTPDLWIDNREADGTIYLWDMKYGHRGVEPESNWQFICYMAGIMDQLGIDGDQDQTTRICFTVVQPRCYDGKGPIRQWSGMASDLRAQINILQRQAMLALDVHPDVVSGNHCQDCPARHACKAARQSAMAAIDYTYSAVPEPLTDEALSFEKQLLDRASKAIELRLKAIDTEVISRIQQGHVIAGYLTENGVGQRRFTNDVRSLQALGELLGVEMTEVKPITPAEFDRRAKAKGIDPTTVNGYIERPATGVKLVKAGDTLPFKIFGSKKP